ncbi:hypothetical protein WICPIJ_004488 [Wickerhamomyces pijperi]|uniref:Uncharacterized protein n=1 Tax=Wickerhamomyces pijperi TaxID=599730 RepID=A0A9P8Q5F3_WICPI|nr:hypothetical protein WICPIJ_004488 [Wickerhamomyces pijperi]
MDRKRQKTKDLRIILARQFSSSVLTLSLVKIRYLWVSVVGNKADNSLIPALMFSRLRLSTSLWLSFLILWYSSESFSGLALSVLSVAARMSSGTTSAVGSSLETAAESAAAAAAAGCFDCSAAAAAYGSSMKISELAASEPFSSEWAIKAESMLASLFS